MKNLKFYVCEHCGNLVEMVEDKGVKPFCCGQKMVKLVPNSVDASGEKHTPVVDVADNKVVVNVGSVDHPMGAEHNIGWVALQTDRGVYRKYLAVDGAPKAEFLLVDEKPLAVYAWCNLHGLWKTELN